MDSYVVPPEDAGCRLDRWLAEQMPGRSRNELQRWIRNGSVTVDGQPAKPALRVESGQTVAVGLPTTPKEPALEPEPIPLEIIYEDLDLVVVNKPDGMVVHPAPGHEAGTLVNAILHHCPDMEGVGGKMRPGIVHRLDKDTSGVIVAAKNDRALRSLQSQFKARTVDKRYIALLDGQLEPDSGRITVPLGRHPTARKRQAAYSAQAGADRRCIREAITEYQSLAHYSTQISGSGAPARFTLVLAKPRTGRTHQLRVHFAWMKHPIVGDSIYGYRKQRLRVGRLFLHASSIGFDLPSTGERVIFEVPLPGSLAEVLGRLGSN